jgi:SAM-dependent methyltransferase
MEYSKEDYQKILRQVINEEMFSDDTALSQALSVLCKVWYARIPNESRPPEHYKLTEGLQEKVRIYTLRQLITWLLTDTKLESIIEIGSCGDTTLSMAFPDTQVTSLDIDPDCFKWAAYDSLPDKFLVKVGKTKEVPMNFDDPHGGKLYSDEIKSNLIFAEQCLPNWHKCIGDGQNIPFKNNHFDASFVLGALDANPFLPEMARVTKIGGYIIVMLDGDFKSVDDPSPYETHYYNLHAHIPMIDQVMAKQLNLQEVVIPSRFKEYENFGGWEDKRNGVVFQIYQKGG